MNIEARARMLGQLSAPFTPFVAVPSPSPSGVPANSADVPTFGGGAPSGNAPAGNGNVDRSGLQTGGSSSTGLFAAPAPAVPCTCEKLPWWAFVLIGAAGGGTIYGVSSYLLLKK